MFKNSDKEKHTETAIKLLNQYALFFGKRSCVPNKPIVTSFELIDEGELTNVFDCA